MARLETLSKAHRSGNALAHLQATTRGVKLLNSTSIRALLPEVDHLAAAVSKNGVRPYLSLTIDLAYRLGRINQPETQRKFGTLAGAVLASKDTARAKSSSRMTGLIRVRGRLRYRQYDENTLHAVATLILSEFGRAQIQRGQTPLDVIRTAAMLWECQPKTARDSARTMGAKQNCRRFTDLIASKLSESGQTGLMPGIVGDFAGGTRVSTFACFESADIGSHLIDDFEAYTACMASQSKNPMQSFVDGASVASGWSGTPPEMPGYQLVDSKETVRFGPNGNTGTQVDHDYKNNSGGTAHVTQYSAIVDGKETSGTWIETNDGNGNLHQEYQDAKGDVRFSYDQHSDGTTETFEKADDGSATAVETHSDGTSDVTHTDSQGNVTTAKIDSNGECTGDACNASTPVDEFGPASNCSLQGNPKDDARNQATADPLGPYIYPAPDSPGTLSDPLLACLVSTLGSGSQPKCPPSVAFCLEPPPPGTCGCGVRPAGDATAFPSGRCNAIRCADGNCNPQTGTCGSSSSNGVPGPQCPGVQPPRPPGPPIKYDIQPTRTRIPSR